MKPSEAGHWLARYLAGAMSADERRRFMDVVLSDQDLYNAFAEESILAEMLKDPGFRAKVNAALQPAPGVWGRVVFFFRNLSAGWRVVIVAAATALLLVPSLFIYNARQHEQPVVARGGAPKQLAPRQPARPANPAPVTPSVVPKPEEPVARSVAHSGILTTALATLTLTPISRDTDKPGNVLTLARESSVRLNIDLGSEHYASYSVVLASPDTRFEKEFDKLQPHRRSNGVRRVALQFPSDWLQNGVYTVRVLGQGASGPENVAGYSFSVNRRK
jgi:hypothetical protein